VTPDAPEYGWTHDPATSTFRKTLPPELADLEQAGWARVAHLLPVPDLIERIDNGQQQMLVYEDVFASGRCQHLLADAITAADSDPTRTPAVVDLIDGICDTWMRLADHTGRIAPLHECVTALYGDRLQPGGRLDTWYGSMPAQTIVTEHGAYNMHLPAILDRLRATLPASSVWPTAITQGDPTEPNIADPICWLDFEHAGRNTIAGEVAVLLWYLLGMGGWLVPAYQPRTYAQTLRQRGHGSVPPSVTHLTRGDRIEVEFTYRARAGRQAAINTLTQRVHGDIGTLLAPTGVDPDTALRHWLALRILGVIPLSGMSHADRAVCLGTLAHALDPQISIRDITITGSPDLILAA
jgi:hypothetical protein